eukprot:TRINITY_DN3200_c0_g1_i1.p1 TRINITY_DN3200_c0_g1~~TRINITY_DN3200_c0_g1_i1.p1  ORF type:complete len:1376 (-),score=314.16 TRINITY_DN3200_c0_g1_i1:537-4664(-)
MPKRKASRVAKRAPLAIPSVLAPGNGDNRHEGDVDNCQVCGSGDSEDGDLIVFCDCGVAVHQSCYGVREIPEGDWVCALCSAGLKGHDVPVCEMCPFRGGAMKRTEFDSGQGWAHVTCALWCPETFLRSKELMEPIVAMSGDISQDRKDLLCSVCGEGKGGCTQCWMDNCYKAFHPLCARQNRWILELTNHKGAVSFCDLHSSPHWMRKRDVILSVTVKPPGKQPRKDAGRIASNASLRKAARSSAVRRATFLDQHWNLFQPFLGLRDSSRTGPLGSKVLALARRTADENIVDDADLLQSPTDEVVSTRQSDVVATSAAEGAGSQLSDGPDTDSGESSSDDSGEDSHSDDDISSDDRSSKRRKKEKQSRKTARQQAREAVVRMDRRPLRRAAAVAAQSISTHSGLMIDSESDEEMGGRRVRIRPAKRAAPVEVVPIAFSRPKRNAAKENFAAMEVSDDEPVVVSPEEPVFTVEAIMDRRRVKGEVEYLIKWLDYPPEQNTWEPARNVLNTELVAAFEAAHPDEDKAHESDLSDEEIPTTPRSVSSASSDDSVSESELKGGRRRSGSGERGRTRKRIRTKTFDFADFLPKRVEAKSAPVGHSFTAEDEADAIAVRTPVTGQPVGITGGTMRDYQLEGLRWLVGQHDRGAGGILADEMGLGKTLQVTSFLSFLKDERGELGPHLIVAPLSVLPTWVAELQRWCPSMKGVAFHGPQRERDRIKREVLCDPFDVCITTYEMLLADPSMFVGRFHWRYVVLDEAQRIKNEKSLVGLAVRRIKAVGRLLITGTPLQNNLHELWALLNFLFPEMFTNSSVFDKGFAMQGEAGAPVADAKLMAAAHSLLQPLMLRRLKSSVQLNLPPKTETKIYVGLAPMQKHFYKRLLESNSGVVTEEGLKITSKSYSQLNNLLMQLRKCCDHPFMFGEDVESMAADDETEDLLVRASGKMIVLDKLIARLLEEGRRCLVYSQFTAMLDILEDYCKWRGHRYLRLDGSTALARRRYEVALFNKESSTHNVYLISTRAGGLGINLQTADTVIMYDSDWNPQVDKQAQDRVHRIGQTKPVSIYRLVCKGTCEERILHFAQHKLLLGELVLRDDGTEIDAADQKIDTRKLLDMIGFGAAGVLADTADPDDTDKTIDAIFASSRQHDTSMDKAVDSSEESPEQDEQQAASVEDSSVPNVRAFEGKVYERSNIVRNIADEWTALGKRVSKRTVTTVPKKARGIRAMPILKWSIDQARREKELLAAAAAEKQMKDIVAFQHQKVCGQCKSMGRKQQTLLKCRSCPRVMHLACAGLQHQPRGWLCLHHHCRECGRSAQDAGGLLFRCVCCPFSYCDDCLRDGFEPIEACPEMEKLGFKPPRSYEYVRCEKCVNANLPVL